jgi:hypothetical protein
LVTSLGSSLFSCQFGEDVSDAAWLADLGAHGLVKASFVPPAPIRELRDLTRTRTVITRERTREVQRLEKLLEDAGIKLSSVACDITGVSGRAMLEALIAGQRDPGVLADLAKRRMRSKIPALTEALHGRFNAHHAFMARLFLDRIDAHSADTARLDARIAEAVEPFGAARAAACRASSTTESRAFATLYADVFPTAMRILLADKAGVTTHLRFPVGHHARIRHSNLNGPFGETERRTKVIGRCPAKRAP